MPVAGKKRIVTWCAQCSFGLTLPGSYLQQVENGNVRTVGMHCRHCSTGGPCTHGQHLPCSTKRAEPATAGIRQATFLGTATKLASPLGRHKAGRYLAVADHGWGYAPTTAAGAIRMVYSVSSRAAALRFTTLESLMLATTRVINHHIRP
jgi:hypothetical protein